MAVERHIPVVEVDRRKLDELAGDTPHQGVAAVAPEKDYAELDDIFELAAARGEKPLIVIADEINDPHNLGAIIRSAEAAGAHGIIIPKRRSAPITPTVAKASAGAVSWLPVVKVTNLSMLIEELRDRGVWIFCAETGGADYRSLDYDTPAALIVGSEGEGVSRLLREKSDFIVSIPMKGQVNSLNVSCAAAVMLFKMTENRSPVQPEFPEDNELFDDEFDGDDEFGDEDSDIYSPDEDFKDTGDESAGLSVAADDFAAIAADGDEAPEDLEDLFMLDGIDIDFDL
jgi:23S rRNA (guanosine2251-2'-O)-methyltransferase